MKASRAIRGARSAMSPKMTAKSPLSARIHQLRCTMGAAMFCIIEFLLLNFIHFETTIAEWFKEIIPHSVTKTVDNGSSMARSQCSDGEHIVQAHRHIGYQDGQQCCQETPLDQGCMCTRRLLHGSLIAPLQTDDRNKYGSGNNFILFLQLSEH